jgi:hypothetical protein
MSPVCRGVRRVTLGTAFLLAVAASPAAAHGAGALGGLPIPRWQFAWGVAAVVVLTFFVAGSTWRRPRLAAAADGRDLGPIVANVATAGSVILAVIGLVTYTVVVTAGLFGTEFPAANIAPIAVFITFWVGIQFVSFLLGDVWRALSPFATLALVGAWLRARVSGEPMSADEPVQGATHWPAVVAVAGFLWLELAYHAPTSPRILGWAGLAYGVVVLAVAARRGRGWLRTGEGFAALFSLLAAMAPLHRVDGRLRLRWPLTGLARVEVLPGTVVLVYVVLGAAVFDGFNRTQFWFDLTIERVGWGYTAVNTLGLLWAAGIVALVHQLVSRVVARVAEADPDETVRRYLPTLVPVVAAFTFAHYFSALVLEGQGFWFLISNPYGEDWDLFGTADGTVDFQLVSVASIAWVQAAAIAVGTSGAVLVAHDRAISDLPPRRAVAAQYVLLALYVAASVAAVALLVGT